MIDDDEAGLIKWDGLSEARIGVAIGFNQESCIAYDIDKVLEILSRDMSEDEAFEYFEFNLLGACVGPKTPIFVSVSGLQ